jgi:hypothetical protein
MESTRSSIRGSIGRVLLVLVALAGSQVDIPAVFATWGESLGSLREFSSISAALARQSRPVQDINKSSEVLIAAPWTRARRSAAFYPIPSVWGFEARNVLVEIAMWLASPQQYGKSALLAIQGQLAPEKTRMRLDRQARP